MSGINFLSLTAIVSVTFEAVLFCPSVLRQQFIVRSLEVETVVPQRRSIFVSCLITRGVIDFDA